MTTAAYTLTSGTSVVRNSDKAVIPDDPTLFDWQQFQTWLAAGNTADPYVAPVVVPSTIIGFIAFTALFTATEQQALFGSSVNWQVQMLIAEATSAGPLLDLADPRIFAGVNAMVALGILTTARATAILANQAPPAPPTT